MSEERVMELCAELGKILSQTNAYKRMKKVEYEMLHDSTARKMMEDLQALQMEMQKKRLAGLELTEEDNKKLKEMEEKTLENPLVKESYVANTDFQSMMVKVSAMIREGIRKNEEK